jgi:ribonuclease PH
VTSDAPSHRHDDRAPDELRPFTLTPGFMPYAEGSCFAEAGDTKVICTATVEDRVPRWMLGKGLGWITAEYSMLPRSSPERIEREVNRGRPSGRTQEIQRLVGRSLRAAVDLGGFGERSITLDCDVVRADGGTRTAAITGSYVALAEAMEGLLARGKIESSPFMHSVAAVSVGIIGGVPCLDLDYVEDRDAEVDMNVVMTGTGKFIEVQGTAEHGAFERALLDEMLELAAGGIDELTRLQEKALGGAD